MTRKMKLPKEKPAPVAPLEILRLPPPYPKPVTVPLSLLPAYMEFHKLKPTRYRGGYNILLVTKEGTDEKDIIE